MALEVDGVLEVTGGAIFDPLSPLFPSDAGETMMGHRTDPA
jgi:hypothetical protein